MKKRLLILAFIAFTSLIMLGCSGKAPLLIWVGKESQEFYTAKMVEYVTAYNASHTDPFPYEISVLGVDTGSAAATFLDDTEAGADIFTIAHDNLGKLIAGSSSIAPITNAALLAQIAADNSDSFQQVILGTVGGTEYTFGVPYIAQSLVLYYNKLYITETQAQTWEGILEAARAVNKQSVSLTGTDGYNNSFLLLARKTTDLSSPLRLYEGGVITDVDASNDDMLSILKWGQRFFADPNGIKRPSDSGWEVELADAISLSVITGAWKYAAAKAALGTNLGITTLPSFTITADDVVGTAVAGTSYYSGTFADTKILVMKKNSEKAAYLEDIMLFLSSKTVQEGSFNECANLPAYKNALAEFTAMQENTLDAQLAVAQIEMFAHGIPQPFGYASKYNVYYYQKGAPDLLLAILENVDGAYTATSAILAQMHIIEQIWKTGAQE
jgi:arabinogalactan oligomer/maltooligosaccharide transport system substrate-binding protein